MKRKFRVAISLLVGSIIGSVVGLGSASLADPTDPIGTDVNSVNCIQNCTYTPGGTPDPACLTACKSCETLLGAPPIPQNPGNLAYLNYLLQLQGCSYGYSACHKNTIPSTVEDDDIAKSCCKEKCSSLPANPPLLRQHCEANCETYSALPIPVEPPILATPVPPSQP